MIQVLSADYLKMKFLIYLITNYSSLTDFLNSLIPLPIFFAIAGNFPAPKRSNIIKKTIANSGTQYSRGENKCQSKHRVVSPLSVGALFEVKSATN